MTTLKAFLTLLAALAFIAAPIFLVPGFGGFDPNRYPIPQINPPIQPAGYAFSIWGFIYTWLLAMATYGIIGRRTDAEWDHTRTPLILSLAIGASWLSVARVSPLWATILIWIMLITALIALFRTPTKDRWWLEGPVALYAGWLSAASFVSIALLGAGYGFLTDMTGWAWICLSAAVIFAAAIQTSLARAPEYAAGVVWALVAIAVTNWSRDTGITITALLGCVVMTVFGVKALLGQRSLPAK